MVPATRVRKRKGQLVVSVPADISRRLVLAEGALVYWAHPRTGQALLSVKPTAARGPERRDAACSSCAAYQREIERLRARLADRPLRVVNQGVAQGWAQATRHLGPLDVRLDAIEAALRDLSERMPFARRAPRAGRRAARTVQVVPAPPLEGVQDAPEGGTADAV